MTKLTDDQVAEIRRRMQPCSACGRKPTLKSIAQDYEVSAVTILKIIRGEIHRNLD